jgi:hypothetical protein
MGWASGSELAEEVWELVREYIPKRKREQVAKDLVNIFEDHDCDTMEEAELLMEDAGLDDPEDEDDEEHDE